jgi:hypothetical protein
MCQQGDLGTSRGACPKHAVAGDDSCWSCRSDGSTPGVPRCTVASHNDTSVTSLANPLCDRSRGDSRREDGQGGDSGQERHFEHIVLILCLLTCDLGS